LFSIFSKEKFYYNINKVESILSNLKMKDSKNIFHDLGKEIENIKANLMKMNNR